MSNANARRFKAQQIIMAAAIATLTGSASIAMAQVPVIDGTRDAAYGSAITLQTVQTQFGDANPGGGSELDGAYAKIVNGTLYTTMTGNLEGNFNKFVYFFDTRAGGQNVMRNDNPGNDFNAMAKYSGMTFDAGFSPDYAMWFGHDNATLYLHFAELNTNGGGFGAEVGSIALSGGIGAGTIGGVGGSPRVQFAFDNTNIAGVIGGTAAADQTAAAAVATGAEFAIDLPQLGALGDMKVMVGVNGSGHDYWSNQFLAGLTPPQGNLGSDGTGAGNGSVGGVNFNNFAGDQFFTINYTAPQSEWNFNGNGNWSEGAKWTGSGVPNAVDARAILGSLGGATPRVITLDQNVRLQSLTFDNAGGYTINPSGNNTLTIAGNAAIPSVVVSSGNHTIAAPVVLGATTNFGIAAGSSLNVQNLTAAGQPIVKSGAGLLQVNNVRTNVLAIDEGTVRIATNGTNTGGSELNFLNIAGGLATPTATLDLNDNDLIIRTGTPIDAGILYNGVVASIASARNGGIWNGTGISSSAAAAATPRNKTLGSLVGSEYLAVQPTGAFGDFTATANDVLVKYTYYGDTDLNGQVNFDDYSRIDNGFNTTLTGWFNGDFDYNGSVNFDDYSLIDLAFNTQSGTLIRAMDYLEGEDRSMRGMDTPELQMVVDHFAQFGNGYASSFLNAVPEPTSALALGAIGALSLKRRRRDR